MDYEKLIDGLWSRARTKRPFIAQGEIWTGGMVKDELCAQAARAIESLRAENSMLRKMQPVELSGESARAFELALEASRLRAENEKLRAELERVRENNKKLCSAMMTIQKSENQNRMCVVYKMDYAAVLSHDFAQDIARILFDGLMREDLRLRGQKED